jgi:catechol 2,3-dioxygenase-like lactoylglutathione lyase family enzyme
MITLGVDDLGRAKAFYIGLGWSPVDAGDEGIVFFNVQNSVFALYPWAGVADEFGRTVDDFGKPNAMLAYNVRTKEEVAKVLAQAEAAGGTIAKPAQDVFWGGHSGYFRDPDGHYWEVAHNPFSPLGPNGEAQIGGT